jgi:hypothetical protein
MSTVKKPVKKVTAKVSPKAKPSATKSSAKLKIGDHVVTSKGRHGSRPASGVITSFTKWKNFDACVVKKDNTKNPLARNRIFLMKNLSLTGRKVSSR